MNEQDFCGEVLEILIPGNFCDQLTAGSCDTDKCVLIYADKAILVTYKRKGEDADFKFCKIENPDRSVFSRTIKPAAEEHIIFEKFAVAGIALKALKFKWNENYLFVFADCWNLIITKGCIDISEEEKYESLPDYDPSILFIE